MKSILERTILSGIAAALAACGGSEPVAGPLADSGAADVSRVDATSPDGGLDAGPDVGTDAPSDADHAPRACDLQKPFGAAVIVPNVSSAVGEEISAHVLSDELTIYFSSDRVDGDGGWHGYDLYYATRSSRTADFGAIAFVPGVFSSASPELTAIPTEDNLTLYFDSSRTGGAGQFDLWIGTRQSALDPFSNLHSLSIDSSSDDMHPFLRADGNEIFFTSNRGQTPFQIYRALGSSGTFGNAIAVTELNTSSSSEIMPVLAADGLTIFFSSDRIDGSASGFDIWMARRPSLTSPFSAPTKVQELNSSGNETMGSLSVDGCRVYFTSNRGGSWDIYFAERPR